MHTKNFNVFINYFEKKFQNKTAYSRPWKFFIEVSASCNLKCITCGHHNTSISGVMKNELFEAIKPMLSYAKVVHEMGYGEPFIDIKFIDKLRYLKQMGTYVDIYTNGMLLTPELSEQLVRLKLDQITFSIDAGTKETFESIRIGSDFFKVLKNIEKLHQIKRKRHSSKPFLRANYVGMRRNIEELPRMIQMASEIGIKEVVLSDMYPPSDALAHENLYYHKAVAKRSIQDAKAAAKKYRVTFISPSVFHKPDLTSRAEKTIPIPNTKATDREIGNHEVPCPKKSRQKNPFPCNEPWQTLYIGHDGHVKPCCVIGESFGNIFENSISEIWNNEKYQILRKSVNTQDPVFEACRQCLLRKRVHFTTREAILLGYKYLIANGPFHTAKKAFKYLLEYF